MMINNMTHSLSGGILAGGKSTRMGSNKAFIRIGKERMLDHVIRELSILPEIKISAAEKGLYENSGLPVVYDKNKNCGPIEGIRCLLQQSSSEYVLICAVDMPFVSQKLFVYLASYISSDYDCFIPSFYEEFHPFPGIYSIKMLPIIEGQIQKKEYGIKNLFKKVPTKHIPMEYSCFESKMFKNINTRLQVENPGPVIFCVSGMKNSGKTTMIKKLIPLFAMDGYRTAVIKHDSHDCFTDVFESDTFMFSSAGAACSVIFSERRYTLHSNIPASLPITPEYLIQNVQTEINPHIIILEGLKHSTYPKIEMLRNEMPDSTTQAEDPLIAIVYNTASAPILSQSNKCPMFCYSDITSIYRRLKEYFNMA